MIALVPARLVTSDIMIWSTVVASNRKQLVALFNVMAPWPRDRPGRGI
jgi:hypothetical protein